MSEAAPAVLILGIGNLLWADEGFGVRAVEQMHREWQMPDTVRMLDGGTQGIYLVQEIRDCDVLIVFDAVDYALPPGTLKRVEGADVPKFMGVKKVSLHQTGFQEVLMMAEMMGDAPTHQLLIGVQPVELDDFGGSLRPQVKVQIEPAIAMALEYLGQLGIHGQRRAVPLAPEQGIGSLEMVIQRYEEERPDEAAALRLGDERVVGAPGWQAPKDFDEEMAALVSRVQG